MYDNIGFYLNSHDTSEGNLLECILSNGNNLIIEKRGFTVNNTPFAYVSIKGENEQKLTFKVFPFQLSMIGKNSSVCKFKLGHNFETLSLKQFQEVVSEISERLSVDVSRATVCRIDLATNFEMKHNTGFYTSCLTYLPRYLRVSYGGNLYFKTSRTELIFYDKLKEYRQKGLKIPDKYKNLEKLLRYELRLRRGIAIFFGRTIILEDLCKEDFFYSLFDKWKQFYNKIIKQNPISFNNASETYKTSDFRNYLMLKGVEAVGGINYVYSLIDENREAKIISSPQACYLKKVLNESFNKCDALAEKDYVKELDDAINSFTPTISISKL